MRFAILVFAAVGALALPTSQIKGLSESKEAMKREETSALQDDTVYPKPAWKRDEEEKEKTESIPYSYRPSPY